MKDGHYYALSPNYGALRYWLSENRINYTTVKPIMQREHARGISSYRLIVLTGWDMSPDLGGDYGRLVIDRASSVHFTYMSEPIVERGVIQGWRPIEPRD